MTTGRTRQILPSLTIRTWAILWAGSMLVAWGLLLGGWLVAKNRLANTGHVVSTAAQELDESRQFETAILATRREDLRWQSTHDDLYRQRRDAALKEAEDWGVQLVAHAPTDEIRTQAQDLSNDVAELKTLQSSETPASVDAVGERVDSVLIDVDHYQAWYEREVASAVQAAHEVEESVSGWVVALAIASGGLLALGALGIVTRVVRPTTSLVRVVSAYGAGDFSARAPVLHDDELGALAGTFNNMAEDIARREENRLNFIAIVVHDIKNPLQAIEMSTSLLSESEPGDPARERYLETISREVGRVQSIIRDLIDDIQVSTGELSLGVDDVDLCALVRSVVGARRQVSPGREITVDGPETCVVDGDVDRLERVVLNLLSNALKYTPADSPITVAIEKTSSDVVLRVTDRGPGISPDDLKVLFQPFGRGHAADTLVEGSGIGLYAVKRIVEAHHGTIIATSRLGEGTTFTITLPAQA